MGIHRRALEKVFDHLKGYTARIGLTKNSAQAKHMIARRERGQIARREIGSVKDGDHLKLHHKMIVSRDVSSAQRILKIITNLEIAK